MRYIAEKGQLWDEEWELGYIDSSDGQFYDNSSMIRGKNYYSILPNASYYYHIGNNSVNIHLYYYDSNKNYISHDYASNQSATSPSNAYYLRIRLEASYGTTYNHDISINYPSSITTYQPSVKKRVVADCGVYTFTGNELWGIGSTNNANKKRWQLTIDGLKFETNSSLLANLHIDGLTTVSADNNYFCTEGVCSNNSNSRIYIYLDAYNSADKLDDFKQFMAGKTLYYETIQYQPRKIANCGCVDLGSLNWNQMQPNVFNSQIVENAPVYTNDKAILNCKGYTTDTDYNVLVKAVDKSIAGQYTQQRFMIYDSRYNSAAELKQALNGVLLYYETIQGV